VRRLELNGVPVELVDTAGWHEGGNGVEAQAQLLGREQAEQADLILLCLEAGRPANEAEETLLRRSPPPVLAVATKCDLAAPPADLPATSAVTRAGLADLRGLLAERARAHRRPALAPSLARCWHHVESCLAHLRQAHAFALHEEPPELLALELRSALEQLGEMVGAVYTDDLLGRIFSRFCIGK
jgi:tRNA modification GTPase